MTGDKDFILGMNILQSAADRLRKRLTAKHHSRGSKIGCKGLYNALSKSQHEQLKAWGWYYKDGYFHWNVD